MAVKSSTKKRLIELGIPEDQAHKLADDANLDAIKRMSREQVAKKVGIDEAERVSELDHIMSVISEHVGSRKRSKSNSCLLYTSPSPRDRQKSRMPSSA